jgi:hypothetical protein
VSATGVAQAVTSSAPRPNATDPGLGAGLTPDELARRSVVFKTLGAIDPGKLTRWLLRERLATLNPDGLLVTTDRGRSSAAGSCSSNPARSRPGEVPLQAASLTEAEP